MGLLRDAALRGSTRPSGPGRAQAGGTIGPEVKKNNLKGSESVSPLSSYLLAQSGLKDSSFKKAQETLHYVAKEIQWQGLGHLRGLTSSRMASGAFGKHPQNVKRDMLRKLAAKNPDSPVPIERVQVPLWELDGDGNYFVEERNMPVVLPHRLFPWMMRRGIWPTLENEGISTGSDTMWAFLEPVVKSFQDLYNGISLPSSHSSRGSTLKVVVTELRGDWKYLVEILQLSRWYRCNFICHRCFAHKDTFMESPAQLHQKRRCSFEEFFQMSVKPGPQCPLFKLPQMVPQCIRFDSMHVLCLGVDLLVAGNVIQSLVAYDFWGDGDEFQKLLVAWQHFKAWAKKAGWKHSMPRFCPKRLKSSQHPYPELQAKAWNCRVVIAWLSDALQDYLRRVPDDLLLKSMEACTTQLAKFHRISELNGRYLCKTVADRMSRFCDRSVAAYIALANMSLDKEELGWPSRPKFHAWQEICQMQLDDRLNHRFSAGWHSEDFVGRLVDALCKPQTRGLEESGLVQWYVGLCAQSNLDQLDAQL